LAPSEPSHESHAGMPSPNAHPPEASLQGNQPVLVLGGRIDRERIPDLCAQVRAILAASTSFTLGCDVETVDPDSVALDALARMALTARRLGRRVELRGASTQLEELVIFAGLIDVLPCLPDGSGVQARRQPEQRKEAGSVEEECDPADPAV
jgi:ABC-type transporter Mla MlaB component